MEDKSETFVLTEEHLELLRNACIRWEDCESGAPAIDCKRPYGNSGVRADVAEILGLNRATCPHCEELISEAADERLWVLHLETENALQILVQNAGHAVEPGVWYRTNDYNREGRTWHRKTPGAP